MGQPRSRAPARRRATGRQHRREDGNGTATPHGPPDAQEESGVISLARSTRSAPGVRGVLASTTRPGRGRRHASAMPVPRQRVIGRPWLVGPKRYSASGQDRRSFVCRQTGPGPERDRCRKTTDGGAPAPPERPGHRVAAPMTWTAVAQTSSAGSPMLWRRPPGSLGVTPIAPVSVSSCETLETDDELPSNADRASHPPLAHCDSESSLALRRTGAVFDLGACSEYGETRRGRRPVAERSRRPVTTNGRVARVAASVRRRAQHDERTLRRAPARRDARSPSCSATAGRIRSPQERLASPGAPGAGDLEALGERSSGSSTNWWTPVIHARPAIAGTIASVPPTAVRRRIRPTKRVWAARP